VSQSLDAHHEEQDKSVSNDKQAHYLVYKGLMSELSGLTQGNPEAHAAVLRHLRRAKSEAIEIRKKHDNPKDQQEVFYSSNLPLNTQERILRGGREWIK
jgi:hypothetical protein